MVSAYALKKLAKAGVISTTAFKKSKIKKFENTYTVPISYVGLLELTKTGEWNGTTNDTHAESYDYSGTLSFNTAVGECLATVWMTVRISREERYSRSWAFSGTSDEDREMERRAEADPNDIEAQTYMQNYGLREENQGDSFQKVTVSGSIRYSMIVLNENKSLYNNKSPELASVDDFLDWVESQSTVAWGDVTIAVEDLRAEVADYQSMEEMLPSLIHLDTAIGGVDLEVGRIGAIGEYGYTPKNGIYKIDDGVKLTIECGIAVIESDDERNGWYDRDYASARQINSRSFTPYSYQVYCSGEIIDENTQVSDVLRNPEYDSWTRGFGYEGALELEDAKQTLVQNINELAEEFNAYVASNRNYVEQRNGVGHARTTVNTEDWTYNFGDTEEDIAYDRYQSREYEDRIEREIREIVNMDYSMYSGPLSLSYDGIVNNKDGTFTLNGYVQKTVGSYTDSALREDVENNYDDYKNRVIDAFKTNLTMNGYEIISFDFNGTGFTAVIRPTVAKSKKMKKSIEMMRKSRKFRVIVNDVEQDGLFTADECGEKTGVLLGLMGSCTVQFIAEDSVDKSSEKSKTKKD